MCGKNYFPWLYLVIVTPLSFSPVKNKPNHIFSMMVLSISNYLLQTWRILNKGSEHRSVVSDSLLLQARVHSLSLLHGIFPTQGSNHGLPHCGRILYQLSYRGSPRILEWVAYPFSSGSSWPRNQTGASCIAGGVFTNWAIREALNNGKTYTNLHDPRRTRRDFGHGDIIFFAEKHSVILSTETLCPFFLWKSPSWRVQALCKGSY